MSHPSRNQIPARVLQRVRKLCLAYPETAEKEAWGHPTFRVKEKMFASVGAYEGDAEGGAATPGARFTVTMTMKAADGKRESLIASGDPFFFPKYVGVKGWIGVRVDKDTDWDLLADLIDDAYRLIAPKRLVATLDQGDRPRAPSSSSSA